MLRTLSFFAGILISTSLPAQHNYPAFTFDNEVVCDFTEIKGCVLDVGNIPQVDRFEIEVPFTNTGSIPLIILDCKSTGGGMFAWCPREPIGTGEGGIIHIVYHTANRFGSFHKPIKIFSNSAIGVLTIQVKGNIVPEAQQPDTIPFKKE